MTRKATISVTYYLSISPDRQQSYPCCDRMRPASVCRRLLITHWTCLQTFCRHINGTRAFFRSDTIPIILHMRRISAILHWQNPRVFFLSPNKKVLFSGLPASPGYGFLFFIGTLHSTCLFILLCIICTIDYYQRPIELTGDIFVKIRDSLDD